ncbi:MAG: phosphotransferase [Candidatus Daviesbacteria bacterium]|nr:MAG: phosphotransferase [Candidatus Daviesbacteria bacterium]
MSEQIHNRLNYSGSLEPVVDRLCRAYDVGQSTNFSVIEVGYEDCNVAIDTSKGKYVAKIFAKYRKPEDITRYATIMEKVVEAGVNHPPLKTTDKGELVYSDPQANGISMVLMDFIEGKTYFELNSAPNDEERRVIIEQAVLVNGIDHHPPYIFDSIAIPNIQIMFDRVRQYIKPEDLGLVEQVMALYNAIPVADLPHCFVHGDFIKTNVLKGTDGKIYILDFSVSNWYPRIQELAVIAANLLHDSNNPVPLRQRTELIADEYSKFIPLTQAEREHLYPYAIAGVAMEFMGAHQEKYINGIDTGENEYWLNLGREGLKRELNLTI